MTLTGMYLFVGGGCVRSSLNTFGADQYKLPEQSESFKKFFFLQMMFVKIGALLGRFVNPIFREDVNCFQSDSCYPLAFGFPAFVMFIAVIILICVKSMFVLKRSDTNMIVDVSGCIFYSIKQKIKNRKVGKEHWLDHAKDKYPIELVDATKVLMKTMTIFFGTSIYWSCFLQQNSRWIFQASRMNGDLGFYTLKPDQIIAFNPISALILTPLCNYFVYPLMAKCGIKSLLHRIFIGGYICCASFVLATLIEIHIQSNYISMLWLLPQYSLSALSEIFVMVSLMNFAYAEAPSNMKSVITALVFLSIALGDSLIPIISGTNIFKSQVYEFIFFTCLLFVNMIVFAFIAKSYEKSKNKSVNSE